MAASKALEKRIDKLERKVAAHKRRLEKSRSSEKASARELVALRGLVTDFVETALARGITFWCGHPDVAAAADELVNATEFGTTKRKATTRRSE